MFVLLLGTALLLKGKIHFGYIYGVGAIGCISMCLLLNLMSETPVDLLHTTSVLGYCFLPIVALAFLSLVITLECAFPPLFPPSFLTPLQRYRWANPRRRRDHMVHSQCVSDVCDGPIHEGAAPACGVSCRHALRLLLAPHDLLNRVCIISPPPCIKKECVTRVRHSLEGCAAMRLLALLALLLLGQSLALKTPCALLRPPSRHTSLTARPASTMCRSCRSGPTPPP